MNIQKAIAASALALALGFAAFSSMPTVSAQTTSSTTTMTTTYDTVLNFANLKSVEAPTTGSIAIIKKTDGTSVLRLQNLKTEAGPDLRVYLYAAAIPSKTATAKMVKSVKYLELGKVGAPFSGFYEYNIPNGTNLAQFKSAIIWCDLAGVTFAGANLN
jgi:Electron transfer DM13